MTDYTVGDTLDVKFTTRQFSDGVPTALVSGTIVAYVNNTATPISAGITLSANFNSVTGLNNVRVVATTGNGYASGATYYLVISVGTVGGVSVVGEVVGEFTLGRSAAAVRTGVLTTAAATGDPGTTITLMGYIKQLVNILIGTNGIATFPAEAAPGNAVSLAEVIRAIHADVTGLNGSAMRGTDSAFLASSAPTNFSALSITAGGLADITQGAADKVWGTATRLLSAGTNIVLAKGVGVTGFNDIAATDIVSNGAIDTTGGAVDNVTLVDTTTANTDMRGTDDAALASVVTMAAINAEVDTAIETYHLDHLLAASYNPASPPGDTTALLNELVENDGGVSRFTQNALEQAPDTTAAVANVQTSVDALNDIAATDIVSAGAITTLSGAVVNVDLVDTLTTYTGNTLQTGDVTTAINDLANATDGLTAIKAAIDNLLTTAMTESYAANGAVPTVAQALMAIHQSLMDFSISGTSKTVEQLDGTTAFIETLDDGTNPTSLNRN